MKLIKAILVLLFSALQIIPSGEEAVQVELQELRTFEYPPFAQSRTTWADSILQQMSVEEKIGQLFMIAAYSNRDESHYQQLDYYIKQYHIGGLIFFQGDPVTQARLTNRYQAIAKYPLMIGIDAEWGLAMRLDSTVQYPRQLLLGAIRDDRKVYEMGLEIGRQHKRMGIHVNFAPVVDVNNNPNNPVINDRSFGEDRENVAKKGIAYMNGLQDMQVMACAKHFPGHGDTDVDSHYDLPVILHDSTRLDSIEFYPFKKMIEAGVSSVMVAHLNIPALDSTANTPSTLSHKIVNGLLKRDMGFNGLVFTDALNMKGVTKYFSSGESSLAAFLAGNDVLLFPDKVEAAVNRIKTAYSKGQFSEADLDRSVRKILLAKQWVGLPDYQPIADSTLVADLNTSEATDLRRQLVEAAITVAKNDSDLIPLKDLGNRKISSVTIGSSKSTVFTETLDLYADVKHHYLSSSASKAEFDKVLKAVADDDIVLANMQNMSRFASRKFGLSEEAVAFAAALNEQNDGAILTIFGTPYSLARFPGWDHVIVAYEASEEAQSTTAQIIFGGRSASGMLPVSAGGYEFGDGVITPEPFRLRYGSAVELGYEDSDFYRVDSIITAMRLIEASPGCQVLIAKDGLVFYNKSHGYHTYKSPWRRVKNSDLYDIASITKVAATTPLIMRQYEDDFLDLDNTLEAYLDLPETSNKHDLVIKEMLAHQSGLWPWIPFYVETLDSTGALMSDIYDSDHSDDYPIAVCDDMFCSLVYQDSIWSMIHHSKLRDRKDYKYSDLGFYYFKDIIEGISNQPMEDMAGQLFYGPLGMNRTTYKPLDAGFSRTEIVPTETDVLFRGRTIHGYVHDPGAAMMGGVGGHAGVFSNANDLAKYMQMLLNGGHYGGHKFFDEETVDYFTKAHYEDSRRGLGFDKPDPERRWGSACDSASLASFGHTGFTGTMAFADPEHDLVFIFLSNRIHPTAENKKLISENIRTQIHQAIYDVFLAKRAQ